MFQTDWNRTERQPVFGCRHRPGRRPHHHDRQLRPASHPRQAEAEPASLVLSPALLRHLLSVLPSPLLRQCLVLLALAAMVIHSH